MIEILLPSILLGVWAIFSSYYIIRAQNNPKSINQYILESIPSVFPTLGILCTAAGITLGLINFDTNDIQGSLPTLLNGLKSAFGATIAGIIGLLVFQKWLAYVQKHIESSPDRPRRMSDELEALEAINYKLDSVEKRLAAIENEDKEANQHLWGIWQQSQTHLLSVEKVGKATEEVNQRLLELTNQEDLQHRKVYAVQETVTKQLSQAINELAQLRQEQKSYAAEMGGNSSKIIDAMGNSNKLLTQKFDEFSVLMQRNNTEALVEVMKKTTEQFNKQMSELINRLVQENFKELNTSVKQLNTWQHENKQQIEALTKNFHSAEQALQTATTNFKTSAELIKKLSEDGGKLTTLIKELDQVMISDKKFTAIVSDVQKTIETLSKTTDAFDATTQKLNNWVRNQMNFNDKVDVLITQLESFRNLNGSVWDKYRGEMERAVGIIKVTSTTLNKDLENINAEFYARLSDTLRNLDDCIQRFMDVSPNGVRRRL